MKKKIMFLMPAMIIGGAEKVLLNFFDIMDYDRYEVDLYVGTFSGELINQVPPQVNVKTIFPNYLTDRCCTLPYRLYGIDLGMKYFARKIRGDYDIGISFCDSLYSDLLLYSKANIKRKAVVIQSSYKTYVDWIKNKDERTLRRHEFRYGNMDTIIAVSEEAMGEFTSLFGKFNDMRVIYNPFNISRILSEAEDNEGVNLEGNKVNIVAVGRLNPVKGYDRLIKACAILKNKDLAFKVNIIGTGAARAELQKLIDELNLSDYVELKGFVEKAYPWVKDSDIYVMTSLSEGLPTALCEAMLLHKPVLTTNISGCREVIESGKYGLMVEGSPEAIAEGLQKLIENEELRQYYQEQSRIKSASFNDDAILKEYYNLFDSDKIS